MKYLYALFALLVFSYAYTQNNPVLRTIPVSETHNEEFDIRSGDYIKDTGNNLQQYIGTWQYNQDGIIFSLKLTKVSQVLQTYPNGDYEYYDEVITTYKLVKNNIILVDNLSLSAYTGETSVDRPKYGVFRHLSTFDYLTGVIRDLTTNVILSYCEITRLPGTQAKIFFKFYPLNSWKRNPSDFYQGLQSIYSLPNEIELLKID